MYIIYIILH